MFHIELPPFRDLHRSKRNLCPALKGRRIFHVKLPLSPAACTELVSFILMQAENGTAAAMAVVAWLLVIGTVWGITNALIKRGALIADQQQSERPAAAATSGGVVGSFLSDWIRLLCVWQYSVPFLLNLSMSVLFILKLGDSPITLAVPVTNATTFAVTAVAGAALGEKTRPLETAVGVALIVAGVTLCISPPIRVSS